jgi:glutamate synthase (NADPH) small chain
MGNLRGFLETKRKDPGYRPVEERLKDYNAVDLVLSREELQDQAGRCMDCGTPFCHAYGCPVANVCPEFNEFVYRGNWKEALDVLLTQNNFPEFTGRICPAPCETACVAGISTEPVTIRQIELAIIERGFEEGYMENVALRPKKDKRIAVVGSGPAGLAAADQLNRAGFQVVVYDEAGHAGGILRYGIPDFKLEKWVVERRIHLMKKQGVVFEMDVAVGKDLSFGYLKSRFDAICLAAGAREPRDLKAPGRELGGIHFAMDYLTQQNKRVSREPLDGQEEITAAGKTVVVIGGGDTGSDCLGTALRQGAGRVYQLEILPKPPIARSSETPWPLWPMKFRKTHAHEEGGKPCWSVMTKAFRGENVKLKGLLCVEVEWISQSEKGPLVPQERPGTEFEIQADMAILAMGFSGPCKIEWLKDQGVTLDSRGNVVADEKNMTHIPGVFVAGDMTLGQSLVVRAIASGQKAARGIMGYLEKG